MSTLIMAKCWPLQMPPVPKAVLISLADNANDHGHCWPSMAKITERTCCSERAVRNAVRWLEDAGVISTQAKSGTSNSYQITPESFVTPARRAAPAPDAAPARGAEVPRHMVPPTPARGAGDPGTSCPQTVIEPSKAEDQKQKQPPAKKPPAVREPIPEPPDWVDAEAWAGFADMRKRQRFPLTARAAELIFLELEKLRTKGHDPTKVLDQSTRNAWRDVYPLKPEETHATRDSGRRESVAERAERFAREGDERDAERARNAPNKVIHASG